MNLANPRLLFLYGLVCCLALLGAAFYLEHVENLEPCPLCMTQRVMFYGAALFFLIGAIINPPQVWKRVVSGLCFFFAAGGAGLAGRQIWLQNLPEDQVPACGPSLEYMLDAFPLTEVITVMLQGTGDCAEVQWAFLGLTIPGWSLVWFVLLALLSLIIFMRKPIS